VLIWTVDNIGGFATLAQLAASGGSNLVGYLPAGTGAVATTVQAKLRESVSVFDFMTSAQVADVKAGTALIDVATAIGSAITAASSVGCTLLFPAGVYKITSTITWANNVKYKGVGYASSNTKGSVLLFSVTGANASQINNPINSSTFAAIDFEGLTFVHSALSSGYALLYDTGSTYLNISKCKFNHTGAGSFGVVFDQTEISTIDRCVFEALGDIGTGANIWLANGATPQNPTGAIYYTNRITITNNQINPALGGSLATGLLDSGGIQHTIEDNNFNGGGYSIKIVTGTGISIKRNEIEGATTYSIAFITAAQGATGIEISNNYLLSGTPQLYMEAAAIDRITYSNNVIATPLGIACEQGLSAGVSGKIFATNNRQISLGSVPFNNYLERNADTVGTMTLAGSGTLGVQTYTSNVMTWRLIGDMCFFSAYINMSAKDAATAGNIQLRGLPYSLRASNSINTAITVAYMSNITLTASYTQVSGMISPGNNYIQLLQGGSAQAVAFLTAAGIDNTTQIMVSGMYPI
jgi:hypothetical protein